MLQSSSGKALQACVWVAVVSRQMVHRLSGSKILQPGGPSQTVAVRLQVKLPPHMAKAGLNPCEKKYKAIRDIVNQRIVTVRLFNIKGGLVLSVAIIVDNLLINVGHHLDGVGRPSVGQGIQSIKGKLIHKLRGKLGSRR